jgi:hypothetical protein
VTAEVLQLCATCRSVLIDAACPVCADRWSGGSEDVALGPEWGAVASAAAVEAELVRELGPTHPLRGQRLHAVARRVDCDDVLVVAGAEVFVVHLTWRGTSEVDPRWPSTQRYASLDDFVRDHREEW